MVTVFTKDFDAHFGAEGEGLTYTLVPNHFDDQSGFMFETYGDEKAFVRDQTPDRIWTLVDADGATVVAQGWRFVDRFGYFITREPCREEDKGAEFFYSD